MPISNLISRFVTSGLFYRIPALLLALTLHELAHGLVAYKLGDPTAKQQGRLSLNPLKHIDPLGLLALWLVGFGWAKPVPINPLYFHGDRHRGLLWVSLAGPATNFLLAFFTALLLMLLPPLRSTYILPFMQLLFVYNIFLGVFNLLPIPPLDGSKVLFYFLPRSAAYKFAQLEQYGPLILMLLVFTRTLSRILYPVAGVVSNVITTIVVLLTGGGI
ncbi:MAG TPA: site-2 protease family protein [Oscillospiraceae bacterium]|nr:site-2 protease family protein [Oscillospiraceae bacterium]